MKAVTVRCPECNAVLDSQLGDYLTCSYCGAKARIQRRTNIFQIPQRMPQPRATDPEPIAIVQVSRAKVFVGLAVAFSIVTLIVVSAISIAHQNAAESAASSPVATPVAAAKPPAPDTPYWRGGPPLVFDVDRDGIDDLIGLRRYINGGDTMTLYAMSGKDGHVLWNTPPLGTYTEVYQSRLALVDGIVVRADPVAHLYGYAAATGKQLWDVQPGEVVKEFCAGGDAKSDGNGSLLIETADEKWQQVAVATGEHSAVVRKAEARCGALQKLEMEKVIGVEVLDGNTATVPNMSVARVLARGTTSPNIAVGYRRPGTAVSMIAGVAAKHVVWVSDLAASDPLKAQQWGTDYVTLDDDHAIALYTVDNGPPALSVFARADGKRLWDIRLAANGSSSWSISGVGVTRDLVLVALYGEIRAYELATGKLRWAVGPA